MQFETSEAKQNTVQDSVRIIKRMVALCDLNIDANISNMQIKVPTKYQGQKSIRVLGDLYGKPISYNGDTTVVEVNVKKYKAKLQKNLNDIIKRSNKQTSKIVGVYDNG